MLGHGKADKAAEPFEHWLAVDAGCKELQSVFAKALALNRLAPVLRAYIRSLAFSRVASNFQ